jgi:hypothetical protein
VWPFSVSTAQSAAAASDTAAPADVTSAAVPQAPANIALAPAADSAATATAPATTAAAPTTAPATGDATTGDATSPDATMPAQQDPAALGDDAAMPAWVHAQRVYDVRILAGLNIRQGPGTGWPVIGSLAAGTVTGVTCKVNGTVIDGNPRWYRLATRPGWISARYAQNLNGIPPFCP